MTLKPTSSQGSGGGGSVEVTDGVTTVNPASELDFTSGVVVTDGGGGNAQLAVSGSGGGTVTSVSSANTSIAVATGTTTPVLTVGTADKLFTNHAPIAAVALNAQKITGLANGSAAQDGAAFGQIPTALPPNGTAGGDLSGSYPNPAVKAITETSGPTDLVIGTITDGQFLKRSGSTLVSAAGGSGTVSSVTSADTSIAVATGTTTPVLTVAALNTIAANHATSGGVAMNSNKLTGLAAGSGAGDSVRYEQVILSGATAGGALTGTYPNPTLVNVGLPVLYDSGYLAGNAATIDTGAAGIASGHFSLLVVGYLRSTAAVTSDNISLTFNNDSSALYDVDRIQNLNTTVTGASVSQATSLNIGNCPGASAPAHTFGSFTMNVPAYDGTSNWKTGDAASSGTQSTVANNAQARQTFVYESTSAISRLAISNTGSWIIGSRLVVYGLQ